MQTAYLQRLIHCGIGVVIFPCFFNSSLDTVFRICCTKIEPSEEKRPCNSVQERAWNFLRDLSGIFNIYITLKDNLQNFKVRNLYTRDLLRETTRDELFTTPRKGGIRSSSWSPEIDDPLRLDARARYQPRLPGNEATSVTTSNQLPPAPAFNLPGK